VKPTIVFLDYKNPDWQSYQDTCYFIDCVNQNHKLSATLTSEQKQQLSDAKIFVVNSKYINDLFSDFLNNNTLWLEQLIWILIDDPSWKLNEWQSLFKRFKILKVIPANHNEEVRQAIDETWSIIREQEQNEIFNKLLLEKNLNLQNEQVKINKEIKAALENKKANENRVKMITEWGFLLRQSLWIIHRSENLKEVEELLLDLLREPFHLKSIEIVISGARSEKIFPGQTTLKLTLQSEHSDIATLWVNKKDDSLFSPEEKDFFNRLAEALELAISRIKVVEELAELEQQWQRSFDAISDPVVLTSENFDIIQTNSAAKNWITTNHAEKSLTCYSALFGRSSPCSECTRNQKFELTCLKEGEIFEVSSHRIHKFNNTSFPIYIHLYRNVTHIKQMEKSLVEQSSQLALGTLSSSIAHELNNPVGGILTLSQLMKMDFDISTKEYEVFTLIEKKALECKEVIETLLEFTHAHTTEPNSECDITSIIHQGFTLYKTIQEDQFKHFKIFEFSESIILQTKPKLLVDLFYLLFASLHKVDNENWGLSLRKTASGFQILIEAQSKKPIDPQVLTHTPLVQYFKSMDFNLFLNNSMLEINYSSQ
jgi:hypothetical protein